MLRHGHGAGAGSLGLRLALAFAGIVLAAVALLAGLTAVFAAADVSHLVSRQRSELTGAMAVAASAEYDRSGGWRSADLQAVLQGAARVGAAVQVRDRAGRVIAASRAFASQAGRPEFTAPVTAHGQRVGVAVARFTHSGVTAADRALEAALLRAIAGTAGLAALVAMAVGLGTARVITRPVEHLIAVARARGGGDRAARAGQIRAPGELRELAAAFDQMADNLGREEQLRRDLVADVAHELRTPIAVLQAGHEALLDGVTAPTPEQLASLHSEVLRLGRRVADLQTLAATEAAALHLARHRCDIAEVGAEAADSLNGRFGAAGVVVERQLTPVEVVADPHRLHQVITNLLTNALKFTPAGGIVVIRTYADGPHAVLQVIDTGSGIPASELPHIFERFWRGQQGTHAPGSGIGLAVAAELTRAHGGQITAASQPGHGTTMTVTLPRA
jgi:two-component system sensor histidine kinase BaeS